MYIVIEQQVNSEGPDQISIMESFTDRQDAIECLSGLHTRYYGEWDTKFLPEDSYLFIYKYNYTLKKYIDRVYFKILKV